MAVLDFHTFCLKGVFRCCDKETLLKLEMRTLLIRLVLNTVMQTYLAIEKGQCFNFHDMRSGTQGRQNKQTNKQTKPLTAIETQSSPWNFGMYLSPRATSALLSGLKRHTTLMQVSAASVMSAAVEGWSAASSRPTVRRLQGRGAGRAPHKELSADTGTLAPERTSTSNKDEPDRTSFVSKIKKKKNEIKKIFR